MEAQTIINGLKKAVCSGLEIENRTANRFMIHTGYTYPDGDELHILLIKEGEGWILSDEGHTMMWLSYEDFSLTDARKSILDRILNTNGVSLSDGEISVPIDAGDSDSIVIALRSMIQAEIQLADLLYLDKEKVRDRFVDDLKSSFSTSSLSSICSYDQKIIGHDNMEYYADVYINSQTPILVFGIHSTMQCTRATVTMLSLNKKELQFMFMAVIDSSSQIPANDRNKAINAAMKTTIGLEEAVKGAEMLIKFQTSASQ